MVKSSNAYKRQSRLLLAYWLDRPQADNCSSYVTAFNLGD